MLVPPAREYGWEGTTEREEQGMGPERVFRLKAEGGLSWDTEERKTNLEKEIHL